MRNLKKVLSLALVLVMVLALSAGAAYPDQAQIGDDYVDAVNLVSAIKIMQGKGAGQFDPQGLVTRAEMAKMIYVGSNGEDDGAKLFEGMASKFVDLTGADWATNYIKWANFKGIISGTNAEGTTFKPLNNVKGVEAAKMILTQMGFNAELEGYTGEDWQYNIADDAKTYGLLVGLDYSCLGRELTREEAAQMIFNGLNKAIEVSYSDKGIGSYKTEGAKSLLEKNFSMEKVTATVMKTATFGLGSISPKTADKKETVVVQPATGDPITLIGSADASMVGKEVTVYYKDGTNPVLYAMMETGKTVTAVVTNGVALDDDAAKKIDVALDSYYINGKPSNDSAAVMSYVKNGNTATYYGTTDATTGVTKYTTVSVTTEFFGKATVDAKAKTIAVSNNAVSPAAAIKDVAGADAIANNDMVLETRVWDGSKMVHTVKAAPTVEGKITLVKNGKYTINGTAYALSKINGSNDAGIAIGAEGTFYLDTLGNIVAKKGAVAPATTYAMVSEWAAATSSNLLGATPAKVYAVLDNGTAGTFELASVTVGDTTTSGKDLIGTYMDATFGTSAATYLLPYTLTADGKINLTMTAANTGIDYAADAKLTADYTKGDSVMKTDNTTSQYVITDKTVVFIKGAAGYTAYTGKGNIPTIGKDDVNDQLKVVDIDDTAKVQTATLIVVEKANSTSAPAAGYILSVEQRAAELNTTVKNATYVTLYNGTETKTYEVKADVDVSGVAAGKKTTALTITDGMISAITVADVTKYTVGVYEADTYIYYGTAGTTENANLTYKDIVSGAKLITMTKDADGNYSWAEGAEIVAADSVKDATAGTDNVSFEEGTGTNAGKIVTIILWK